MVYSTLQRKVTMKRIIKNGDETDAYSKFRKIHTSLLRAGAVKKIKRRTHRRERQEASHWIREQLTD